MSRPVPLFLQIGGHLRQRIENLEIVVGAALGHACLLSEDDATLTSPAQTSLGSLWAGAKRRK